ncbi:MAG: hypothetical protein NTV04_12950, partial [Deltaproteobacteria bacterium]|nr:hypothetical protein [Deltaproteobacteria bacterium]
RDQTFPVLSCLLSAKRRGGKGVAWLKTAEALLGQRGITAFFGEANALLPRHGTILHKGNL